METWLEGQLARRTEKVVLSRDAVGLLADFSFLGSRYSLAGTRQIKEAFGDAFGRHKGEVSRLCGDDRIPVGFDRSGRLEGFGKGAVSGRIGIEPETVVSNSGRWACRRSLDRESSVVESSTNRKDGGTHSRPFAETG